MIDNPISGVAIVEEFYSSSRRRFLVFIATSIIISFILVVISMIIYSVSGAEQLDLSRPSYKDVRNQASIGDGGFQSYPSSGKIDKAAVDEFKSLYGKQAEKIKTVDAFGSDPLNLFP